MAVSALQMRHPALKAAFCGQIVGFWLGVVDVRRLPSCPRELAELKSQKRAVIQG